MSTLKSNDKRQVDTFLTKPWVFKKIDNGLRLYAHAHGKSNMTFEGVAYGVAKNSNIHVIIATQGKLESLKKISR